MAEKDKNVAGLQDGKATSFVCFPDSIATALGTEQQRTCNSTQWRALLGSYKLVTSQFRPLSSLDPFDRRTRKQEIRIFPPLALLRCRSPPLPTIHHQHIPVNEPTRLSK